jgi:hypothetical protein
MKYKDGELISLVWEDRLERREYVKGHVTREQFIEAVHGEFGEEDGDYSEIKHHYGFWGVGQFEGEPSQMFYERDKPGKGRFKVTSAVYID